MEEKALAIIPVKDVQIMASAIAKSGLFGIKTADQALALMLIAQAEGLHPAIAARDYHIIQGRPALKADAMLARYQQSGGKIQWHDYTDKKVSATFSHPSGGTIKIDWDMDRAKQAGLGGKENWAKYPRQMLRARVISEGVRATNPGCNTGFYTPEEVQDFEPINVTPEPMPQTEPTSIEPELPKPKPLNAAQGKRIIEIAANHERSFSADEAKEIIDWYCNDPENKHSGRSYESGQALIFGFEKILERFLEHREKNQGEGGNSHV